MKITDHIKNANGKTLFSFEIVPPPKGVGIADLYENIDPLMEFKPPFIDVTTSREEYVYIEKEKGLGKFGRLDIYAEISLLIEDKEQKVKLIIENKVESKENNDQTQEFLEKNNYFGYDKNSVMLFEQGE